MNFPNSEVVGGFWPGIGFELVDSPGKVKKKV